MALENFMFNGTSSSNGSCSTVHRQTSNYRRVGELEKVDIHQPKEWFLEGSRVLIHMIYIHYSLSYPSIFVVISMMMLFILTENKGPHPKTVWKVF